MKIKWDQSLGKLICQGIEYDVTCEVRNELNKRRRLHDPKEVVRVVNPDGTWGPAYMPRPFPKGIWKITAVEDIADRKSDFWPIKIRTDAHQLVRTWALDDRGGYDHPEDRLVDDYGYHVHFLNGSRTTLGCGGTPTEDQIRELAFQIRGVKGETIELESV